MKELLFFSRLFKPYTGWLVSGIFLALLTALASIALLTLSGWFITSAAIAGILAPDGIAITFNFLLPAAEIRALAIVRTIGRYAERVVTHEATFRILAEIRGWFFSQLIPLVPGRLAQQRSADLLSRITQDIDVLDSLYLRLCSPFLIALIGGCSIVFFISFYSVKLSLVVILLLFFTIIIIPWRFHFFGKNNAKKSVEAFAQLKIQGIELLQGIAELCSFNAYPRFKKNFISTSENLVKTQIDNNNLLAISSALTLFLSQITVLITIILTGMLFQQGDISGAVMVMLVFSVLAIFELLMPLSSSVQILARVQTAARRIYRIANLSATIIEPQLPCTINSTTEINLKNVSFRYSNKTEWILNNINLHIPEKSKIAIIGSSGAGKTTLLQLIMRFYDPQLGNIKYGEVNYTQLNSEDLMAQFSVLSQQTQLFASTIKQNLLIAKPNANPAEIHQAIKLAGLETFIKQQTNGIESWVGENGVKISGGEARRIALARVYLKNAPILLLDEPTEGLDTATEKHVLTALQYLAKDKTLIMVTHKNSKLNWLDKVYEIKDGICTEQKR